MIPGEGVRLRSIERTDIPTFLRWMNDPEVRENLLLFKPVSSMDEERWVDSLRDRTNELVLAVEAEIDGTWIHVGNVGLHDMDTKNRTAELGIVLGEKEHWGKGLGPSACRTMVRFAFDEMNLHRLDLSVFEFNTRAVRCYEKVGFKREGVRREALFHLGRYHDIIVMGLLRADLAGA